MSGSRCEYIKFRISDVDRGTAEQLLRHEIGTYVPFEEMDNYSFSDYSELVKHVSPDQIVKNMASFRYIDKDGFDYEVPKVIEESDYALSIYESIMSEVNAMRSEMLDHLVEAEGVPRSVAVEAVNWVLPRATTTDLVIGFTPEALIHLCHKRLCKRAQEGIFAVVYGMKNCIREVNPEFAKELVPHCQHLLWCPEGKHSCGAYPTKEKLKEIIRRKS